MYTKKMKTVLVGGVFDILHFGHIDFLNKSKGLGDHLIVALESDKNVKKIKGPGRPFHSQIQRREMLYSLSAVDEVIILKDEMHDIDYQKLIEKVKPNIISVTKGDPMIGKKKEHAKLVGAKIIQIPKVKEVSTTKLAKLIGLE